MSDDDIFIRSPLLSGPLALLRQTFTICKWEREYYVTMQKKKNVVFIESCQVCTKKIETDGFTSYIYLYLWSKGQCYENFRIRFLQKDSVVVCNLRLVTRCINHRARKTFFSITNQNTLDGVEYHTVHFLNDCHCKDYGMFLRNSKIHREGWPLRWKTHQEVSSPTCFWQQQLTRTLQTNILARLWGPEEVVGWRKQKKIVMTLSVSLAYEEDSFAFL